MVTDSARGRALPIRTRLTRWGTFVTLLVCVVVTSVVYTGMRFSLLREVDGFLDAEIRELIAKVDEREGDLVAAEAAIRTELGHRPEADLVFELFATDGRLLLTSEPSESHLRLDGVESFADLPPFAPVYETDTREAGDSRRCVEHVRYHGGDGVAVASYSLDSMDRSLAHVRLLTLLALVIGGALAWVGAWWMARRSLAPVADMTESARRIGLRGLTERLKRTGANDELDRLAAVLNAMLDRLQRMVSAQRRFTADASHELRTPLTALRGMSEVALSRPRSEAELREVIESSLEEYDRLQQLAEGLLLLAQGDEGKASLVSERVEIGGLLEAVVEFYAPFAEDSGVALELHGGEEVEVIGDPGRLRQMFSNLIENAIRYSQASGRIDVTYDESAGECRVTVRDHGIGISAEDLSRIFDRFFRCDPARNPTGTGLGLAICKWIASVHGGSITAESVEGEGTTVTVRLPLA